MTFTCDRDPLRAALAAVLPAVPPRPLAPALACVRLEVEPAGTLTLTAFDGELRVQHALPLPGPHAAGVCLAPAATLAAILKESPDGAVSVRETAAGVVAEAGGRYDLPAPRAADFPDFAPPGGEGSACEVSGAGLREVVEAAEDADLSGLVSVQPTDAGKRAREASLRAAALLAPAAGG